MIALSMKSNIDEAIKTLWWMNPEQIKLAAAKALTFTAIAIRDAEKQEMQRMFDRPTPFTLNSLYVRGANAQRLSARVWFKDLRRNPEWHYLIPQVEGGDRRLKTFEVYLQRKGILPVGMFAVPGAAAKMNQYGNMAPGQLIQILSALQALPEAGYLANKSKRKGARRNRLTDSIFAGSPHPGMPNGIWQRTASGIRPLMIFVKAPQYKRRFDFYGVARTAIAREFVPQFTRALRSGAAAAQLPVAA